VKVLGVRWLRNWSPRNKKIPKVSSVDLSVVVKIEPRKYVAVAVDAPHPCVQQEAEVCAVDGTVCVKVGSLGSEGELSKDNAIWK
jgi:hypothetical protein